MELVNEWLTYEVKHPEGAVFTLRDWTYGMQEQLELSCIVQDGRGGVRYLTSKDRELKIDFCVASWKGITSGGQEVPCDTENKKRLPVGVQIWLVKEIEERSGLRLRETEKKN